jgi:hypothetical protein
MDSLDWFPRIAASYDFKDIHGNDVRDMEDNPRIFAKVRSGPSPEPAIEPAEETDPGDLVTFYLVYRHQALKISRLGTTE